MSHGTENISFDFTITPVELLQQGFYLLSLGILNGWTSIFKFREMFIPCKTPDNIFIRKSKGANDDKATLKKRLQWRHGTDFTGITYIHKKGLNDIILVVTQCNLVTAEFIGNFKKPFPSQPGTQETGIFTVLFTMGQ